MSAPALLQSANVSAPVAGELGFGSVLQKARLAKNLHLTDIAAELRINAQYLEMLEEENLYKLPAAPYAIGFLRAYAQHLGVPAEEMVETLKRHYGLHHELKTLESLPPHTELRPKRALVVTGLILAAVAGVVAWNMKRPVDTNLLLASAPPAQDVPVPEKTATLRSAPVKEEIIIPEAVEPTLKKPETAVQSAVPELTVPATPVVQKTAPTPPIVPPSAAPLILKASGNSWVEVRDARGKSVYSNMMRAGDTYTLPAPDLRLKLGNAGVMMLTQGEKTSAPLGTAGRVVRVTTDQATVETLLGR